MSIKNKTAGRLKPTLWRTCRVLANRTRLKILQLVVLKTGLPVTEIARRLDLSVSVASKYLRELNARGLLKATRQAAEVHYWPEADNSLPHAAALLGALSSVFHRQESPIIFIFSKATAFTHPRRILLVRHLAGQPAKFREIRICTGISAAALKRHLGKLMTRGFVCRGPHGVYAIARSKSLLEATLLKLAKE
jgi:DNA-binding transcriptional ArsR family regulator